MASDKRGKISLKPLNFDQALKGLLDVGPEPEKEKAPPKERPSAKPKKSEKKKNLSNDR